MEEDRIELKTGLGSVKASGNLVVLLVVIMAGFGGLGYLTVTTMGVHDKGGAERAAGMLQQITAMKNSLDENTYVQTLSAEGKKALNLDMPESLRRKMGRPP